MRFKKLVAALAAVSLLLGPTVGYAQGDPRPSGRSSQRDRSSNTPRPRRAPARPPQNPPRAATQNRFQAMRENPRVHVGNLRWSRGDRLPSQYRQTKYVVSDWRVRHLRRPPRGYGWVRDDAFNFFLVAITTGIILQAVYQSDRDYEWRHRYTRAYSYRDDLYYQQCRQGPDPAGIIAGAIIGGLLGNVVGRGGGQAGATVAGVILGGAVGAALTSGLNCEDRSYAYKSYYDGLNGGRPGASYNWRNPKSGHYGDFRVRDYYNDPDGFRCANYTQRIYVNGHPQTATGRACQQPDGSWAVVG